MGDSFNRSLSIITHPPHQSNPYSIMQVVYDQGPLTSFTWENFDEVRNHFSFAEGWEIFTKKKSGKSSHCMQTKSYQCKCMSRVRKWTNAIKTTPIAPIQGNISGTQILFRLWLRPQTESCGPFQQPDLLLYTPYCKSHTAQKLQCIPELGCGINSLLQGPQYDAPRGPTF